MKNLLLSAACLFVLCGWAVAQTKNTANTLKLVEGALGESATIKDVEWLAGSWLGEGLGGVSEEVWSSPQHGTMMGSYRLIVKEKPVFYEMMLMTEKAGTLLLRLKHFDPELIGWEEKDKFVDFKFVKKDGNRIYFSGLTFENADKNTLNIYLALKQKDGTLKEEAFRMKRTR